MAAVTLTIALPDHEAHALAIHWKANDMYSPQVEANMIDVMGEAAEKLYAALSDAGFDVLSRLGPR